MTRLDITPKCAVERLNARLPSEQAQSLLKNDWQIVK